MMQNHDLSNPLVSIVLPTMNGASFIGATIDSILNQTLQNFELIIIDDGSTDNTLEILGQYHDPRIQILTQENQGVCRSTNRGFALARGKYLSRHDHDDLSLPNRFERQVRFLDEHPEYAFTGSWAQIWSNGIQTERIHQHPSSPGLVAFSLLFNSPFVHTSCLMRKAVYELTGGYTTQIDRVPPEDYEFFSRISRSFTMTNLPECLVVYQEVQNSMSSVLRADQSPVKQKFTANLVRISSENLAFASDLEQVNKNTQDFGALVHQPELLSEQYDIHAIKNLIVLAAHKIAKQYQDPAVLIMLKKQLLLLDYLHHTRSGNTYHWSRLKYLYQNRPLHENFGSIGRLIQKIKPVKRS